jgi:hypothetical protein
MNPMQKCALLALSVVLLLATACGLFPSKPAPKPAGLSAYFLLDDRGEVTRVGPTLVPVRRDNWRQLGSIEAWEDSARGGSRINQRIHPVWLTPTGTP